MFKKLSFFKYLILSLVVALALSFCACTPQDSGETDGTSDLPSISYFRINGPASLELELGDEHQLVIDHPAEVLEHVVWSVDGSSVTVDGGKLSAVALGESTVTASYGKLSDNVKITVVEAGSGTTPDTPDDGGTTPDTPDDGGTTPDTPDDGGTTPDTPDDGGTTPDDNFAISNILSGTNGTSYTVRGTVVAYNAQSFLINDSTDSVLVYMGYTWSPDVKLGDVVEVSGVRAEYGSAAQFAQGSTYKKLDSASYTKPTPAEPTAAELNAYSTATNIKPKFVKLTGVLSISTDGKYYNFNIPGATIIGSLTYPTSSDVILLKNMDGSTLEVEGWITGVTSGGKYLSLITTSITEIESASSGGDQGGSGSTSSGIVIGGEEIPAYSGNGYYVVNGNNPFFSETDKAFTGYKYSPLDSRGRATGAFARLTTSLLPSGGRDDISSMRPSGWKQAYYTSIGLDHLFDRSHLLAHMFMDDDVHIENFVTGTVYMNQQNMTTFENMVCSAVKSGSDVLYRVTPVYIGNNLVCSGLLIEAYSIEDGGDDICFCVFLYNVQPGVDIDYATGSSSLASSGSGSGTGSGSTETPSTPNPGDSVNGDVVFNLGANGSAEHADGSSTATATFTEGSYSLNVTGGVQFYTGAFDAKGNSCIKLGATSKVGSFSFTVGADVSKVYIKVAGYKANVGKLNVNGTVHTVSTKSNDGAYSVIEVDTSSNKTVSISTQSGGYRVMIDSIELVVNK